MGKGYRIFIPNKLDLIFGNPNHCAKFHRNGIKFATVTVLTDRLGDACDFTICPMLCHSLGTDKKMWGF